MEMTKHVCDMATCCCMQQQLTPYLHISILSASEFYQTLISMLL